MGKKFEDTPKACCKQILNQKPDSYAVFEKLCKKKNVTVYRVCKDLNIQQGSVSTWKIRGTTPRYERLKLLAEYFDCEVDDFYKNASEVK